MLEAADQVRASQRITSTEPQNLAYERIQCLIPSLKTLFSFTAGGGQILTYFPGYEFGQSFQDEEGDPALEIREMERVAKWCSLGGGGAVQPVVYKRCP